jgi:hypothetical protein
MTIRAVNTALYCRQTHDPHRHHACRLRRDSPPRFLSAVSRCNDWPAPCRRYGSDHGPDRIWLFVAEVFVAQRAKTDDRRYSRTRAGGKPDARDAGLLPVSSRIRLSFLLGRATHERLRAVPVVSDGEGSVMPITARHALSRQCGEAVSRGGDSSRKRLGPARLVARPRATRTWGRPCLTIRL